MAGNSGARVVTLAPWNWSTRAAAMRRSSLLASASLTSASSAGSPNFDHHTVSAAPCVCGREKRYCEGTARSGRLYGSPRQADSAQVAASRVTRRMAQCPPAFDAGASATGGGGGGSAAAAAFGGKNFSLSWPIST